MSKGPHDWKFQQVFGDTKSEEAVDADIISAVEFDHTGNYLAIGDRGGRVVILERNQNKVNIENDVPYIYMCVSVVCVCVCDKIFFSHTSPHS